MLFAVRGIVSRVEIDDDAGGLWLPSSHKDIDQEFVHRIDSFGLSAPDFEEDVRFFDRLVCFSSREGILKSIDRRSALQRNLFSRVNASDGLEGGSSRKS
ncbi:MAG: hypothetical protein KDA90_23025, partial [Planctomycetaceae bacterium]|nr:hypothetical protein [Planctomycetaceae bacterium]